MFWCAQIGAIFSMEKVSQQGHSSFQNQGIHSDNQTGCGRKFYLKISDTIASVVIFTVLTG